MPNRQNILFIFFVPISKCAPPPRSTRAQALGLWSRCSEENCKVCLLFRVLFVFAELPKFEIAKATLPKNVELTNSYTNIEPQLDDVVTHTYKYCVYFKGTASGCAYKLQKYFSVYEKNIFRIRGECVKRFFFCF